MAQQLDVQPLSRGLRILEIVNQRPSSSAGEVAMACGLSHTTTHRLLAVLVRNGFVRRDEWTQRYVPTSRVLRLAVGFDVLACATERAITVLEALEAKLEWPVHFATHDDLHMQIRASTDRHNPLAVHKLQPGVRLPLLQCAAGLACLALQPDSVRRRLTDVAIGEPGEVSWSRPELDLRLLKARRQGFAMFYRAQRFTAMVDFSVPVMVDGRAAAAISVRFAERAVSVARAIEQYLPQLAMAATDITETLDAAAWVGRRSRYPDSPLDETLEVPFNRFTGSA